MLALVHAVPGRLRFRSTILKAQPDLAAELIGRMRRIPGVAHVSLNPITGSLVVCYDPAVISAETVVEQVGSPRGANRPPGVLEPILEVIMQRLLTSAAGAVVSAFV
jgi:hypothetical protein